MSEKKNTLWIANDDFVRRFSQRAKNLMWFLGAGASAAAGIPTAGDIIWELKQKLFVSQRRVSPATVADLANPIVRSQLQAHIDSLSNLPPPDTPGEYAALFESVFPAEADRQSYIDAKIAGAKPSYGHLALATLMRDSLTRLVWTTNFDPLMADACATVYGTTGALTTVALDAPDLARHSIESERWPLEIKLHGDFRSRRLKNTDDELRQQDQQLRHLLVEVSRRFGLVVVGYSGRDDSVMSTFEAALENGNAFPAGLFWLHRGDDPPLARVEQLVERGVQLGVEAALVKVQNFDEILRDLLRLLTHVDTSVLDTFATQARRWSPPPRPEGQRGWPVVRLNGLPVEQSPTVCRCVVCQIGGLAEVRDAVSDAGVNVLASRVRRGVLAFGSDEDVRKAFEPYGITEFDLYNIERKQLRYDSGERRLLREALIQALKRHRDLDHIKRHNIDLLVPANSHADTWTPLKRLVGPISGTVWGDPEFCWREGIGARLEWAHDRLWLIFSPRIVFEGLVEDNKRAAIDFGRERTAKRYNKVLNNLLDFWATILAGDSDELGALGVNNGVEAVFRLSPITAFSRRTGI